MKYLKIIIGLFLSLTVIVSCKEDDSFEYLDAVEAPSNITALVNITQDNTGFVTIIPTGKGAVSFDVYFGDGTLEPVNVTPGEKAEHIYEEGSYELRIVGKSVSGKTTEAVQPLVVSFNPPQNLEVLIENDAAVSKQVNVTATAEFAVSYDVYFGENADDTPVSANIGDTVSYIYENAGTYTIRVVARGGAIETTEYTEEFTVTEILQPVASAPAPPARSTQDVISIFSAAYDDVAGTDYFPDWGQGSQGSSWSSFDLNGDEMLQYINLSYQGIQFGSPVDVSNMEFIHLDVWTSGDVSRIETSLISVSNGERPVWSDLTAGEWTSIDIPISAYTDQNGFTVADIHQLKFVGDPWAAGTVFIDNIYFYRAPTEVINFPINFESNNLTYTWSGFGNADFGPIPASTVNNPDPSGMNFSNTVVEIQKPAGAQVWAGASMNLSGTADFSNGTTVTMKVWSPRAGVPVLFKMEDQTSAPDGNGNPSVFVEVQATTTVANAWEELSFDLTSYNGFSTSIPYSNVIIFPDFGNMGAGEAFYFDDIEIASLKLPLNFEVSTLTYTWAGFGDPNFGPIPAATATNPDQTGLNTSATVTEIQKPTGSQVWAGASLALDGPVDFSNGTTISLKVWSPRAGVPILFKMEDTTSPPDGNGNPTVFVEVQSSTTVANSWEEITFDLTSFNGFSTDISYYNVIIFPDFGNMGAGETFYFDDIFLTN
ncbi:hypothetical protein EV197_0692 [Aquimarina brevivitae]|uniref:PKD domain-containing protein n=2 Tax=Aquimarina brevivitae TaxID=323412 RepID=A0A4Q7PG56_9FLAO|nr:hypothetical protein EV197_0692 [Aquimarina brevivitae]